MVKKKTKLQKAQQRKDAQKSVTFNKKLDTKTEQEDTGNEDQNFIQNEDSFESGDNNPTGEETETCPHIGKLSLSTNLHKNSLKLICQVFNHQMRN